MVSPPDAPLSRDEVAGKHVDIGEAVPTRAPPVKARHPADCEAKLDGNLRLLLERVKSGPCFGPPVRVISVDLPTSVEPRTPEPCSRRR